MAPIIVHVVEDHTVLYTAGGALLGVAVGAGASWLQQRSKIGADKAQLQERLLAEEARLKTQLAHDRAMREREALRETLDIALEASRIHINMAIYAVNHRRFGAELTRGGEVGLAGSKLLIRLDRGHPVVERYCELRDAIESACDLIERPLGDAARETRYRECGVAVKSAIHAAQSFGDSAAALVGSPPAALDEPQAPPMAHDALHGG
jgi:hypothetical protein